MSKISDASKAHTPRTSDVTICLDAGLADERNGLMAELAAAQKTKGDGRLTRKSAVDKVREQIAELEDREREHLHTLRFTKLSGLAWADLAALYPPRQNVPFDVSLGYNHHAAAVHAAKVNGVEIRDGETIALDDDDWKTILDIGAGWDVDNIVTTVLDLNVLQASRAIGRLKKD